MSNTGVHLRNRHVVGQNGLAATRDTHGPPGFGPAVQGMSYSDARDGEQMQSPDIAPESIDGRVHIVPDSIDLGLFVQDIRPPHVVAALPALPDDDYPAGDYAFLTTTSELYVNIGEVWELEDGTTITNGTLIAGLVRAGAIATEQLAADAVIANVANVGGTVLIDDTGITILNGAITLQDYSGQSVLTASGFGGAWADFIRLGVYNGDFVAGSNEQVTAPTQVSDGATDADYDDSLSTDIPMWVVEQCDTTWSAQTIGGAAGTRLLISGALIASAREYVLYQDVPVTPDVGYDIYVPLSITTPTGTWSTFGIDAEVRVEWRDASHAYISDGSSSTDTLSDLTPERGFILFAAGAVPTNARYARVIVNTSALATGVSGTVLASVIVYSVRVSPRYEATSLQVGPWSVLGDHGFHEILALSGSSPAAGMLQISSGNGVFIENVNQGATGTPALIVSDGGIAFTTGFNGADVLLSRTAADVLTLEAGDRLDLDSVQPVVETAVGDAASAYPLGISMQSVSSADGWPNNGLVLTLRLIGDVRTAQLWMRGNSSTASAQIRCWFPGTSSWSSWVSL